jgi:hypothetical protein
MSSETFVGRLLNHGEVKAKNRAASKTVADAASRLFVAASTDEGSQRLQAAAPIYWPGKKSRPVRLANEPATASGGSGALLYPPMDEEWDHFFASSFFMASLDIASSFFMAS